MLGSSATPTQKSFGPQPGAPITSRPSFDAQRDGTGAGGNGGLAPPANPVRNLSASSVSFAPRGSSLNPNSVLGASHLGGAGPGSFSTEMRSQMAPSRAGSRVDLFSSGLDKVEERRGDWDWDRDKMQDADMVEQTLSALRQNLNRELKIKEGSENMLEALNSKKAKQSKEQRARVEAELNSSNARIRDLRQKIAEAQTRPKVPSTPTRRGTEGNVQVASGVLMRSPPSAGMLSAGGRTDGVAGVGIVSSDVDEPTESPTFALAEILQALEVEGMSPEYYVGRANSLVDLFKRHPTLKYDLVWSVFGLRMQVMLLSESREVVAAGYRMTRYAISDVSSLKKIRSLNTDYLVVLSLIKERKADVEREQALKFVRAFLDVKDGVLEISRAVVRTIAAVAEHADDRLRSICLETLAELLVRCPRLVAASGGLAPLSEALSEGSYKGSESLTAALLFMLDAPQRRKYVRPGYELDVLFAPYTDPLNASEAILKQNSKAISSAMKSWSGIMALSMYDFRPVRSLISSMLHPVDSVRDTVIDLLYSLLRIKPPAWATSFLAGRRLTTYGRVASLKAAAAVRPGQAGAVEDEGAEQNFLEHYTALLLAVFVKSGLLPALLQVAKDNDNLTQKRKATLLLGEVLRLASRLLPPSWNEELQLLPELFTAAASFDDDLRFVSSGLAYQISTVSRTLARTLPASATGGANGVDLGTLEEQPRSAAGTIVDDATFRQMVADSGVIAHANYTKWNWDVVQRIIEGPLVNGKRLEDVNKSSKFLKRIMSFYRPFKYRFADTRSTRNTQKYVRAGCTLMNTLMQTPEGVKYLADSKLLRQIAECLAQCDPTSGLTAQFPVFSHDRLADTLCGGYFAMLGVLSSDARGLQMLDRWRIFNMMYHIIDLKQRPDIIKLLLTNFDYGLQGHPRVLLSKALTAANKDLRIHATNALRKYATKPRVDSRWAIQMLVTQLYDTEIDVCATAVKALEKACNIKNNLEYIVECRPSLDHLGEIGAPLLLRFLSTSIGYHYLDGLDYISNEMDDWFLGRNDSYVELIEASLARAFVDHQDEPSNRISSFGDEEDAEADSHIPPHFYRELTRTQEGCQLLSDKGHFNEFVSTIRDHGMSCTDDPETMVKVKACLWAVGNVGSMELGAPFLEGSDVVEQIVKIAQGHPVMGLRGTAFFVLGLISRSLHGLEMLSEHGWDASTNDRGASLGYCMPSDLATFFSVQPWDHEAASTIKLPVTQKTEPVDPPALPSRPRSESLRKALEAEQAERSGHAGLQGEELFRTVELDADPTNQRILELVVDLGNMVLYKRAMGELMRIKSASGGSLGRRVAAAPGFRQPQLFRKVMSLLECNHYRLPIRRLVLELFDKSVLRRVVFDEDEDDVDDDIAVEDDEDDEELDQDEEIGSQDDDPAATLAMPKPLQISPRKSAATAGNPLPQRSPVRGGEMVGLGSGLQKVASASSEELEGEVSSEYDSSSDEQRTERQRSISDPSDLEPRPVAL
jgi:rapamycin-insensitive companion of mTOR